MMVVSRVLGRMCPLLLSLLCGIAASSAQEIDPTQDWQIRSTGALYAENFNYSSTSAVIDAAAQINGNITENLSLETMHILSGKGVRIGVPASGGPNTGSWNNYINGKDDTAYKRFYLQFVFFADEHWLNYPFKQKDGATTSPKIIIIDQWNNSFNPGEVVLTNDQTRGFIGAYRGRSSDYPPFQLAISGEQTPCPNGDPDYLKQFVVDRGSPNPTDTCAKFKQRFGPLHYNYGGRIDAGVLLSDQGTPDADAAVGGVLWQKNGFTVVEVLVDHEADIVKIWAAKYGEVPVLIIDSTMLPNGAELGGSGYTGFQLTPYRTNGATNEQNRRDTYVSYAEVVVSESEIVFPGNYSLPDGPVQVVRPNPPTELAAEHEG